MQAASASLADQIRASRPARAGSSGSSGSGVSSSGLIWPVSGPVVSGFGPRWGRMHEGIDIAVPNGTAVHAAAARHDHLRRRDGRLREHRRDRPRQRPRHRVRALSAIWVGGGSVAQGQAIARVRLHGPLPGPAPPFRSPGERQSGRPDGLPVTAPHRTAPHRSARACGRSGTCSASGCREARGAGRRGRSRSRRRTRRAR